MAIRVVTEIPKPTHTQKAEPFEYTERLKADLTEALDQKVPMFELIGYDSPTYAASYGRDLAYKLLQERLYSLVNKNIKTRLKKSLRRSLGKAVKYIKITMPYTAEPIMKIQCITVNGQKRVFVKIDFDYMDNFETVMVEKYKKYYKTEDIRKELLCKLEHEEWKAEQAAMLEKHRRGKSIE